MGRYNGLLGFHFPHLVPISLFSANAYLLSGPCVILLSSLSGANAKAEAVMTVQPVAINNAEVFVSRRK